LRILPATKQKWYSEGTLRCVGEVTTVNVTRGCPGQCVFCYARCYRGAPRPGSAMLYEGLARQIRRDLDSPNRKTPPPRYVVLNTAGDGFLGGERVVNVTHECLEALLSRGVGVSFSTRGELPDRVVELLGRHAEHVRVFVPIPSLSDAYTRAWEPETALPRRRLFLVQRLLRVGVRPRVRLDPVIPFVNDGTRQLRAVLSAVAGLGLTRVLVSFLHLRPGVGQQLREEAPRDARALLLGGFPELERQPGRYHHLPDNMRLASLKRIRRLANEHRIRVGVCHCANPRIPAVKCPVAPPVLPEPRTRKNPSQAELFE